jgi:hypothetical protein
VQLQGELHIDPEQAGGGNAGLKPCHAGA